MIWRGRNQKGEDPAPSNGPNPAHEPRAAEVSDGPPSDSVGARVESVLEAAERAAAGIREDAESWAREHVEDARRKADEMAAQRVRELSRLTEDLVARARAVAKQSDELISALDKTGQELAGNHREHPADVPPREPAAPPLAPPVAPRSAAEPVAAPPAAEPVAPPSAPEPVAPREPPPTRNAPVSDGARLLATQMSVAGSSREEIGRRLREDFGIKDARAMLDQLGI